MAFDCLYLDGVDLRPRELHARREVMEDVIEGQRLVLPVRRLDPDGLRAWKEVVERGYEGYVAKDLLSPYAGGRTLSWWKVKQKDYRVQERGWSPQQRAAPAPVRPSC
jgi:ATP-dependent DNA ligase